jgi:hypothetical protein
MKRRDLLGSLLAVPFLSGLAARESVAGGAAPPPLRFVLMFTGNGQVPAHWLPTGGETDFMLSPVLEPLEAHRDKLLLVHGLRGVDGHAGGMAETTTGRLPKSDGSGVPVGGPSIDQVLADRWRGQTPLPSLELGVMPAAEAGDHICYSESGLPIPPIGSALGAFERVFGVTNEDPAAAQKRPVTGSWLCIYRGHRSRCRSIAVAARPSSARVPGSGRSSVSPAILPNWSAMMS